MQRIIIIVLVFCGIQTANGQWTPTVEQIEPNIYQVALSGCNTAFYVGETGVFVVDAGMNPDEGRQLISAIQSVTEKPILYLILTHYHFDHVGGVQVFPPETKVVTHESFVSAQKKDGGKLLQGFIEEMELDYAKYTVLASKKADAYRESGNGKAADSILAMASEYRSYIDSCKVVKQITPTLTVSTVLFLKDDKEKVEVRYFKNGHSGNDIVVLFPGATTVHVGDLNFGRSFPFIDRPAGGTVLGWIKDLEELRNIFTIENVLSGHDVPGDLNNLLEQKELLEQLFNEVNTCISNQMNLDQTLRSVTMERYSGYPGRDLLDKAIRAVYEELGGR